MRDNKDLVVTSMATQHETCFLKKMNYLVENFGKDNVLAYARDYNMFCCMFTTDIISERKLDFILLKRFYLTSPDSPYLDMFTTLLKGEHFDTLERKIKNDPDIRTILLSNYIDTMMTPNHHLAINKSWNIGYNEVNQMLTTISEFGLNKNPKVKSFFE